MDNMLELVENNPKLTVVRHLCKTPFDVALNPEFALDDEYYTITHGTSNVFTVVKKDGTTWSFSFGQYGATIISASTENLKERVIRFLLESHVLIGLSTPIKEFVIFSNEKSTEINASGDKGEYQMIVCSSEEEAKGICEEIVGHSLEWERWENCGSTGIRAYVK